MTAFSAHNWIDGTFVSSSKRGRSIDPATYETIGDYPDDGGAAAHPAIEAAKRAFRETAWRDDAELRARVLDQMASAIERNRERLIDILSLENGKLLGEAALEIDGNPSKLRYWAAMARTEAGRATLPKPGNLSVIPRQPMGVAGIIVPWNSPVILAVRSFAPALAAGCTVVVKMPGQAAQIASVPAKILAEAKDLPGGILNMFIESGSEGAALLVASPDVPTISFTGSTQTGRTIGAAGAKRMKRFGLELGGKAPMIVFDDADIDAMLPVLEKALTIFAGQFCMAGSRRLVQSSIYERVRDGLAERLRAVKVGPASDPASDIGPLIDKQNVARVDNVVKNALSTGATAVVRGGPVTQGPWRKVLFFALRCWRSPTTACRSCRRKHSVLLSPSSGSQMSGKQSRWQTITTMACPPRSGRGTWIARYGSHGHLKREAYSSTTGPRCTTGRRRGASSNPVSGG